MTLIDKKILITGGSGFIGSNLIRELKIKKAEVFSYDHSSGNEIESQEGLKKYVKKNFDIIYHLAGFSGSERSNEHKLRCFQINTFSTVKLLEYIAEYSPKTKVILSGSRLEYGIPQYLPVDENHPTVPTSIYGLSKLSATQTALVFHNKQNLNVTVFRTSNVYGPHPAGKFMGYNVVNYFCDCAKKNKPLIIYGDGEQERDYIYISDLVSAFINAATNSKSNGQIYNLGSGKGIKFKDMAHVIVKKTNIGKVLYEPWPKDLLRVETGSYISNLTKVKRELGFLPKVDFEEGIAKTIKGFK